MQYISITGLRPKGVWSYIRFWMFAIPSFKQAQQASGILFCQVKRIKGFQCTLTVWERRDDMLNFMRSGSHAKAMRVFSSLATGKTYGYESNSVPTWVEAFDLLQQHGKNYT